jgi:chromosome segregation ATPase
MIEQILRWLARSLAGILERYADPELDAKLKAFNDKVAEADKRAKEAEREAQLSELHYKASTERRMELDRLLTVNLEQENESRNRLKASQDRVKAIEDEATKLKATIDSRSDSDVLRSGL